MDVSAQQIGRMRNARIACTEGGRHLVHMSLFVRRELEHAQVPEDGGALLRQVRRQVERRLGQQYLHPAPDKSVDGAWDCWI